MSKGTSVFFSLLNAGLWDVNSDMRVDGTTEWNYIYRLAQDQSVQGLLLQGIEKLKAKGIELSVPQVLLLQWIGEVQMIEQRNKAMNAFVVELIEKLRKNDADALLVKGQGVAQCYEKPLWRCSGDVDLFLSDSNYEIAKRVLVPLASEVETEYVGSKHLGMTIDGWGVELHGHLYSGLSSRVERELDSLLYETFYSGQVRFWMNGQTQIFLLKAENDAFYVFTHILQHFYKEGVGLRQICDWCRLLWTYKDSLNSELLEKRIRRAGLMSEWKAFGALAIEYLGFPKDAMPLLDVRSKKEDVRWRKKADRIMEFILKSGNMGHNRDMSHFSKYPYLIRKCVSMGRRIGDLINHARIFPLDSLRFFPRIMWNGMRSAVRGEG
ncbi:nucleotidyltransferase domain-containing protein [Xylanibacter brevis]|uniref:nucleotidyltransferase domain-containing protein n=1 Tax=Xylanibacter brevis TaxID=83231 RepID=UPI0018CC13FD|nr:nucleotidyltransferase family protein [Xylanibacter brevis]